MSTNRLTSVSALLLLGTIALGSMGCVAQSESDRLQTLYRKSQEQVVDLQARLEEANARYAALETAGKQPPPELLARIAQLEQERDATRQALADAEARIRGLAAIEGPLPAELDQALADLAAANPELMAYDAKRGMIKFRSDLTFDLGSDVVKPGAIKTLGELASVINSPVASAYEARIVGHTDNVPIGNPATRAKHPTNWHLSVHRAISVKDVMEKSGVAPMRLSVAGYGQYRPVVTNGPKGAEANRRVEIFLVRNTAGSAATAAALPAPAPTPKAAAVPTVKEDPAQFK